MFPRFAAAIIIAAVSALPQFTAAAAAQEPAATSPVVATSLAASMANVNFTDEQRVPQTPRDVRRNDRSWTTPLLASLQAATVVTQMLDVHSTMQAVRHGAVEANPMMGGLVQNRAAFIGVKAAMGAGLVLVTHKLAKDNKVAAIAASVAINSAYLMVARHNYRVAAGLRQQQ
jgi:hypothetical protein